MMVSSNSKVGDTTLTKVFVGGLAWETPKETLREHFEKFGEILEAVIISDRLTGRSKGYGFVTVKEAEAAKKACEESSAIIINGRRANCNLASLGARSPRSSSNSYSNSNSTISPPPPQPKGGSIPQMQWYYPVTSPISPSPASFLLKVSYSSGGGYMNGHMGAAAAYPSGAIVNAHTLMAMYPQLQSVYHRSPSVYLTSTAQAQAQAQPTLPHCHCPPPSPSFLIQLWNRNSGNR